MRLAVRSRKLSIGAGMGTAVLESVAGFAEMLNAFIEGHNTSNLLAELPPGFTTQQVRAFGIARGSQLAQYLPLGAGFPDLAGDFWAETDPALRGCFSAAIGLLVTSLRGQQNHL